MYKLNIFEISFINVIYISKFKIYQIQIELKNKYIYNFIRNLFHFLNIKKLLIILYLKYFVYLINKNIF